MGQSGRKELPGDDLGTRVDETVVVPVVAEEIEVLKRTVETGGTRIRKLVHEREEAVELPLLREDVEVERVPVNRFVEGKVEVRTEGDTLIVPVLEEVLVTEKRLLLREELRVTRTRRTEVEKRSVTLRREEALVEPLEPGASETDVAGDGGKPGTFRKGAES